MELNANGEPIIPLTEEEEAQKHANMMTMGILLFVIFIILFLVMGGLYNFAY